MIRPGFCIVFMEEAIEYIENKNFKSRLKHYSKLIDKRTLELTQVAD